MRSMGLLLVLVTLLILGPFVVYPRNMGEHTPIWELEERLFGDEYAGLRSEYFISLRMKKQWSDKSDVFYIGNKKDIFRVEEVYLEVWEDVARGCKVKTSGMIEWELKGQRRKVCADALTDTPLNVSIEYVEYELDETEDSKRKFEAATGMDADELLGTVSLIRNAYRETLKELSEEHYREVCAGIKRAATAVVIMWGAYVSIWCSVRIVKKQYWKSVDESMKDFL